MAWLATHIWIELLLAALIGGLIGWALRGSRKVEASNAVKPAAAAVSGDIAILRGQLDAERAEKDALRQQLASVETRAQAPAETEDEGSLTWRNRYLESRVRFLEGKLADAEGGAAASGAAAPATAPAAADDTADADSEDEVVRLKWRNRYLEGRVKYLEEQRGPIGGDRPATDAPAASLASSNLIAGAAGMTSLSPADTAAEEETIGGEEEGRPLGLKAPRGGQADDLKAIAGIGPKIEATLNGLGIFHFDQMASWTEREISWVNAYISFRGRIERENWVGQAKQLAQGVETDGMRKYREGKHT